MSQFITLFVGIAFLAQFVVGQTPTDTGLKVHNQKRGLHGVPALTSNATLDSIAQKCADHYAKKGTIDHSCPFKKFGPNDWDVYGENLYWQSNVGDFSAAATSASNMWYNEIKDYDFDKGPKSNDNFYQVGHFTEMIWKNVKQAGFAGAKSNGVYIVGIYNPSGNWMPYSNFVNFVPKLVASG